jgi:hypothetical protein
MKLRTAQQLLWQKRYGNVSGRLRIKPDMEHDIFLLIIINYYLCSTTTCEELWCLLLRTSSSIIQRNKIKHHTNFKDKNLFWRNSAVHFSTINQAQIKFTCRVFTECINLSDKRQDTKILQFIYEM